MLQATNLETFDLVDGESGGVGDLLKVNVGVGVGLGHPVYLFKIWERTADGSVV